MTIYRGYDIEKTSQTDLGHWVVKKDGKVIAPSLASEDAAMNWIDAQRRKELAKS